MKEIFAGDQKHLDHFLLGYEKIILGFLLPRVPFWLGTVHLTSMTILWSIGVIICGFLSVYNMGWLWVFSACIFLQHITDMLDGEVGRNRNTGLIKWGFYMDHFLDYIFTCAIIIGYSFLLPSSYFPLVLLCLTISGGFMVHTFLDFSITNNFKISFNRFGVSEIRYVLILLNAILLVFGRGLLFKTFPYIVGVLAIGLFILIYKSQQLYGRMDMELLRQTQITKRQNKKILIEKNIY